MHLYILQVKYSNIQRQHVIGGPWKAKSEIIPARISSSRHSAQLFRLADIYTPFPNLLEYQQKSPPGFILNGVTNCDSQNPVKYFQRYREILQNKFTICEPRKYKPG